MRGISRRRLIQVGVGGAAVLALSGGVLSWLSLGYSLEPGEVAIGFSVKQFCIARSVVDTILPQGRGQKSGVELGVPQRMDEQAWASDPGIRADLKAALELIEHVPPLYGHFGRLTSLARADREDVLRAMLRSSQDVFVRTATAIKELTYLCYYTEDATWPALGYDGPWVKTPRPPESAERYAALLTARRKGAG